MVLEVVWISLGTFYYTNYTHTTNISNNCYHQSNQLSAIIGSVKKMLNPKIVPPVIAVHDQGRCKPPCSALMCIPIRSIIHTISYIIWVYACMAGPKPWPRWFLNDISTGSN